MTALIVRTQLSGRVPFKPFVALAAVVDRLLAPELLNSEMRKQLLAVMCHLALVVDFQHCLFTSKCLQ
eukprot:2505365-Amphidinium_carterae.1